MQNNQNQYSSSQTSPNLEIWQEWQEKSGMYTYMLLEDFTRNYSIVLSPSWNHYDFYKIEPSGDLLESLLSMNNPQFLDFEFDKLLSGITRALIRKGKAFVEIIVWKDCSDNIKGISFNQLRPILSLCGPRKSYFISKNSSNKICIYSIENKNLILFNLHDLGYSHRVFSNILKKINKFNISNVADLTLDKNCGFDFSKYVNHGEYNLLKYTKEIYWYGRNRTNQYMNDFYLMWREVKFRELKKHMLDYLLNKINSALATYRNVAKFSGTIIANCIKTDFSHEFEKLTKGEISISQFSDMFYSKGDPKQTIAE